MGFWTRQWAEMQGSYLRNLNKPIRIEGWIGRAQLAVWEFTLSLWVYRNKVLHGGTEEERMKTESQKIRSEVERQLSEMEVGHLGLHLLDQGILAKSTRYQKKWLCTVESEKRKFRYERRKERYLNLRRWLLETCATQEERHSRWQHQTQQRLSTYYGRRTPVGPPQARVFF